MEILPTELICEIAENAGKNSWILWLNFSAIRPVFSARSARNAFIKRKTSDTESSTRMFGMLHSVNDMPSRCQYVSSTGRICRAEWHSRGQLHRGEDKPTIIDVSRIMLVWCQRGHSHREIGPARINLSENYIRWMRHGEIDRPDGGIRQYVNRWDEWFGDGKIVHEIDNCYDPDCDDDHEKDHWIKIANIIIESAVTEYSKPSYQALFYAAEI